MKRLLFILLATVLALPCARAAVDKDRYAPTFYGVELPEHGARVLLVVDRSQSMALKASRKKGDTQTRWERMEQEVATMAEQMAQQAQRAKSSYAVAILYEGGGNHAGSELYPITDAASVQRLTMAIHAQSLGEGGNFAVTFNDHLWQMVSKYHLTHIIFLGDKDIDRHADEVLPMAKAWYAPPAKLAGASPAERQALRLKAAWLDGWKRRAGAFSKERLPPLEGTDVVFHCITLTNPSQVQQALAALGHGQALATRKAQK